VRYVTGGQVQGGILGYVVPTMNREDDMRSPVERNLGPGESSPVYASNSVPPDPARSKQHELKTTVDRVDEHDRTPVVQHDLSPAIKIEGYLVPSSLAGPAVPEQYWLAAPSRSTSSILVDFGSAAVVAAVVTLFATGRLPTPWNIGASEKTEQRSVGASTRAPSASGKLKFSLPALSQPSAMATRPELESQSVRIVASPDVHATAAQHPDPALNRSRPPAPGADSHEADKGQQTAAVSPSEPPVRASALSIQFIIAHELQSELSRVGCYSGNIDGDWNAASRLALQNFNKHAGTKLDVEVANLNALGVIRSRMSRICPLVCNHGSRVRGNRCVEIEMASGRRNADRNHVK
jgi:hypothetical protein